MLILKSGLGVRFFYLGANFHGKGIEALGQFANVLKKLVVENDGWDGDKEAGGGSDKRFGDAGRHGAQACSASVAEAREGVNDAPDGTEKTDEGRHRAGGSEPGHALFGAAHFLRGSELHADGNGLQALQFSGGLRIASADLAQELAIASIVNGRKRRARGSERLRISYAFCRAKDADELIALTADTAEKAELLENHGPGNNGENSEQDQDTASNRASLRKDVAEVGDEQRSEQENDATP